MAQVEAAVVAAMEKGVGRWVRPSLSLPCDVGFGGVGVRVEVGFFCHLSLYARSRRALAVV